MIAWFWLFIEVFAEIPDFRRHRGKRHPLPAILSLACCAMLCGYRSYSAIAEWGRNYGGRIAQALGFTHNTPCAATLHTVFRHVDRDALEAKLGAWAEGVVVTTPAAPSAGEAAVALDGKTLRGSSKQGAPGVHLLSALSHHLGLTLAQQAVDDKTNEITQVETVLRQLVLPGRVLTMDALLTQRHVAQTIVDAGGDYVMIVKNNQPQLRADIELVFTLPPAGDRQESARTVDMVMVASSSAISQPVRPWWATAIGPVWRRCSNSGVTSSPKKQARNRQKWSMGSPVCVPNGQHPTGCSISYEAIGRLRISHIGSAM